MSLKILGVDGITKVVLGDTHTKNPQTGEITRIAPATFVTHEGHRYYYWYKMYFSHFGRESPKNYVQMVNILREHHDIDGILNAMQPN